MCGADRIKNVPCSEDLLPWKKTPVVFLLAMLQHAQMAAWNNSFEVLVSEWPILNFSDDRGVQWNWFPLFVTLNDYKKSLHLKLFSHPP